MRKLLSSLLLLVVVVASGVLTTPGPAQAARYVYVQNQASTTYWPVLEQLKFVDYYAGSIVQYRACRSGVRCVKVIEQTVRPDWFAQTVYTAPGQAVIKLNPQRRGRPLAEKRNALAHEYWHALVGTSYHNPNCTSVTYANVHCPNGTLPRHDFTEWERYKLRTVG